MADRLMSAMRIATAAAAWTLAVASAHAQGSLSGLSDPTRPPGAAAMGAAGAQEDLPAGRQLQSVLFSGGRKLAVIDGHLVALGGTLGDARVVKISETEVVLRTGTETETLRLYPGVEKSPARRAPRGARSGEALPAPLGGKK